MQYPENASPMRSPAHQFNLYGWKSDKALSDDENYMDIVFLITRSSFNGQQGHMGSLIVKPSLPKIENGMAESDADHEKRIFQGILGAATNTPLFGEKNVTSDIHAEINALGQVLQD